MEAWRHGDIERRRARYRILVLAGMPAKEAGRERMSPGRFRSALQRLGIDPSLHADLAEDRRLVRRLRRGFVLPSYVGAPVQIHRVVSRPGTPPFPDLGAVSPRVQAVLLAAGVVRSEDGNVPW